MLAKAVATESRMNFLSVKGPELFSKWVGESEQAIHKLFLRARALAPAVLFFDEVDAVAGKRGADGSGGVVDRVLSQLLMEMDGVTPLSRVVVMAATNRPDALDAAFVRPGRIDRMVFVPPPDEAGRRAIFQTRTISASQLPTTPTSPDPLQASGDSRASKKIPIAADVSLDELAKLTDMYSGAEVVAVCREASLSAVREAMTHLSGSSQTETSPPLAVTRSHFLSALQKIRPQITQEKIDFYKRFLKEHEDCAG
jgi:transitional endoplasmic reticulum ATPase